MSPSVIAAGWLKFQLPSNFEIRWMHKYTGRQYLDNTGDKYRSLNPFYFSEIWLNKGVFLKYGGKIDLQFQVLNVFNARYASNGYTFMYTYGTPDITQEVFVYPQAGRHFMLGVNLSF
jgi:iron complex outermembrane receptor protein